MKKILILLCAGALFMGSTCNAPVDNSAANIETFKKFDEAWNTGNLEGAMAFVADDAVVTLQPPPPPPGKGVYTGKAEIEAWGKDILSGPFHVEVKRYWAEGNKVYNDFIVTSEYFKKGLGVEPATGTAVAEFENGKMKSFTPAFDSETMAKATVVRFFTLLDAGDLDAIEKEVLAPDVVIHFPGSPNPLGIAEYKQMGAGFRTAFPDGKHIISQQVAEGDKVATYMTLTGTNSGEFMGMPASGKAVSINGTSIDRVKDGKIVERWVSFDQLGMMQQIGALPTPGATAKK